MRNLSRFFISVLLSAVEVLSLLAGTVTFVHAQTAAYAETAYIDASKFPQVSA